MVRPVHLFFSAALLCLGPSILMAQDEKKELLLISDTLEQDEITQIVTASGHVELEYDNTLIFADKIIYNQKTEIVTATGNVKIVQSNGDTLYADFLELNEDLTKGFIDHIRMVRADNSKIVARNAERLDKRWTEFNKARYTPCTFCEAKNPLWEIKAQHVLHDDEKHDVIYEHATLDFAGIPIAYTPYIRTPDPTIKRRSGFLPPRYWTSPDLGSTVRGSYYYDIAPDKDATFEATMSAKQGPGLGGQYRQRFEDGYFEINASGTYADLYKGISPNRVKVGKRFRGHVLSHGLYNINDNWRTGFKLNRTTDDSYLNIYNYNPAKGFIDNTDILTSRAYLEGFHDRDYSAVDLYSFQDLRPNFDRSKRPPLVAPWMRYSGIGAPDSLLGGRMSFDTNILSLQRTPGLDMRRIMIQPGWQMDTKHRNGFVTTVRGHVLASHYMFSRSQTIFGTTQKTRKSESRLFPQAFMQASYPLLHDYTFMDHVLEPVGAVSLAPNVRNQRKIPNEDSPDFEFDTTNLFWDSRFSGIDRLDDGPRAIYGLKNSFFNKGDGYAILFFGQSYRLTRTNSFSSIPRRRSDYVGTLNLHPNGYLGLDYQFRLHSKTLKPKLHNVIGSAGPAIFRPSVNYIYINEYNNGVIRDFRQQISYGIDSQFTPQWSGGILSLRDLGPRSHTLSTGVKIQYDDECFTFLVAGTRDHIKRTGVKPGSTVFFQLMFKTIGGFTSPRLSTDIFQSTAAPNSAS